jgi:cytochrome P450
VIIGDYVIPKGATLFSSMASMHMNPNFYKDPEVFNPERFMDNTQKMATASHAKVIERDHYGFGWGRRICPGIHLVSS